MNTIDSLFYIDNLSIIMGSLIGFVGTIVGAFSIRYLSGDRKKTAFFINLFLLVASTLIMVCADSLALFWTTWTLSNFLLTKLMQHKPKWKAASYSANIAWGNFIIGSIFLMISFLLFYSHTKSLSIITINNSFFDIAQSKHFIAFFLLVFAAKIQSALYGSHKWLLSSLNSPTPVSALMHAGLINGGGFLLARFAPLLLHHKGILYLIFYFGIITALIGGFLQLIQSDIKRLLACSTMGQMGFMIVQCGLGLFPAAVAHLCWHGLFKAYLFLASGSAAQQKKLTDSSSPSGLTFFLSLVCGCIGASTFSYITGQPLFAYNTTIFISVLLFITGAQFSLPLIQEKGIPQLPLALFSTVCMSSLYSYSVLFIEHLLPEYQTIPLTFLHIVGLVILVAGWLIALFINKKNKSPWFLKLYVRMLNASQPDPQTITSHRNDYHY